MSPQATGFDYGLYDRGRRRPLTDDEARPVTITLPREAMERVHELLAARAVSVEAAEEAAMSGFGSGMWRKPADAVRRALRVSERARALEMTAAEEARP